MHPVATTSNPPPSSLQKSRRSRSKLYCSLAIASCCLSSGSAAGFTVLAPAERGGKSHCLHDALVGAATADIPVHVPDDLFFGGFRSVVEKRNRGKNHSRSAVAALESFCLQKSPLHRMESVAAGKSFDGRNLFPDSGAHLSSARADRGAIGEDRARAALTLSAAVFRSGKLEMIAQHIKQHLFRRDVCRVLLPVNLESKGHGVSP